MNLKRIVEGTEKEEIHPSNIKNIIAELIDECIENKAEEKNDIEKEYSAVNSNNRFKVYPKRIVNWYIKNKKLFHRRYGEVNLHKEIIDFPNYEILSVIPLLENYCFVIFTSLTNKNINRLYLRDLRVSSSTKQLTNGVNFKFFISNKKLRSIRDQIKSCARVEGSISLPFFFRMLAKENIGCFCSKEFIEEKLIKVDNKVGGYNDKEKR